VQDVAYLRLALLNCLHTHLNKADTETSALTLGLAANPTNMKLIQKRCNKSSTKKGKITRKKFLSYLRNKILALW
jgi:hypothetical protein